MTFDVSAQAYLEFMGRYSEPLADQFVELAQVHAGQQVLDVGCGPGALTARLVERVGAGAVLAIDPSPQFVAAARTRLPGVDVRLGDAEQLPFDDGCVDVALAQLVVHFMTDPVAGLAEMGRVTRPGGVVAASVWAQGRGPLSLFNTVAREFDTQAGGSVEPEVGHGGGAGELVTLFEQAGLDDVRGTELTVHRHFEGFDEWWQPLLHGVGPAGSYVVGLDDARRAALRERCAAALPDSAFTIDATAWVALGRAR